jgi:hypothetical protein
MAIIRSDKRNKEKQRQERQVAKDAKRKERKQERENRPPGEPGVDPDIAGIVVGPQPVEGQDEALEGQIVDGEDVEGGAAPDEVLEAAT